ERGQFTDTCRVAGSPADEDDAGHTFGAQWVGRIVFHFRSPQFDNPTEVAAPRFAAEAAARRVPLKRQSAVSLLTRAESRVHPRTGDSTVRVSGVPRVFLVGTSGVRFIMIDRM